LSRYLANTDEADIHLADNRYADTDITFADTDISVSVKISAQILALPIIGLTLTDIQYKWERSGEYTVHLQFKCGIQHDINVQQKYESMTMI
jgi:hypothetical protein